jgi:type I restriction enzyme R subunit
VQSSCASRSNSAAVDSSPTLRNKKDAILDFVDRVSASDEIGDGRRAFVDAQHVAELDAIIVDEDSQPRSDQGLHRPRIPQRCRPHHRHQDPSAHLALSAVGGHGEKGQRVLTWIGVFFGLSAGGAE